MQKITPYTPPLILFSPHLETIFPALMRRVVLPPYERERIETPDGDFLDLDWLRGPSDKLVIISHGLEGNSQRAYVKGMAKVLRDNGYDVIAWNYRGCSGEMNRRLRFYHSGATDDLNVVIDHAVDEKKYRHIYLVGFSLGGNITLKLLGESRPRPEVRRAVAISVPLELRSSCEQISRPSNRVYSNRFLRSLKAKVRAKSLLMPELSVSELKKIRTIKDFDDQYTAPLHGFTDAIDYYNQCSSIRFVEGITTPSLIINTRNDPFLSPACFPTEKLNGHHAVTLEVLQRGGHVGFTQFGRQGVYWSEQRTLSFFNHD